MDEKIKYSDKYAITTALDKIYAMNHRINIVQGGTSAGKTIGILIRVIDLSFAVKGKVITVTTDTLPNLRKGAMRDFANILKGTNRESYYAVKETTHTYTNLCTGTIIEFYSCDADDALGARRDYLFVNEANRISYDTFTQLEIRTVETIWLDFNPVNEFWVHKELLKRPDIEFIKLNYLDNEALDRKVVEALELRRGDGTSNWWKVYGLGEVGSLEGNIYQGWLAMDEDEMKKTGKLIRYGLDFGFGDETALVAIYQMDKNTLGIAQIVYEKGISASGYPDLLKSHNIDPSVLIVADSARPEIIADIKQNGYRIIGANKDKGSVVRGIDRVKTYKIYYCGKDLEREFMTYAWRIKKSTGETIYEPEDGNDHLMDALRYAIDDLKTQRWDF